jgi:hypothetical protein
MRSALAAGVVVAVAAHLRRRVRAGRGPAPGSARPDRRAGSRLLGPGGRRVAGTLTVDDLAEGAAMRISLPAADANSYDM